jgi:hypothetical protein
VAAVWCTYCKRSPRGRWGTTRSQTIYNGAPTSRETVSHDLDDRLRDRRRHLRMVI